MWSWGYNQYGALGHGNTTSYSSPKQVGSLTTWYKVKGGQDSVTIALKTDGTLWTWGSNGSGQLGIGNRTNYSSPKQVGSLTTWTNIDMGGSAAFAVKTDGTLWSWGSNNFYGTLGLGNTTNYSSPKQVGALTDWLNISTVYNATLAVKTDGTMWSWGRNDYGQLGLGNRTYRSSPTQVGALTTWLSAAAGGYLGVAVKTDGTLWSWGGNSAGELGLGNTTNYSSPKQVGSATGWKKVSAGNFFALAIREI